MTLAAFIPAWANVIAQFEGFNSPGSVAARNHNPGNLKYAGQAGAVGRDARRFAVFSDDVTGFQALYAQLQKYVDNYPDDSILDITAHYLGQSSPTSDSQGDAFTYAAFVASALGTDMSTTLRTLAAGVDTEVATATLDAGSLQPDSTMASQVGYSIGSVVLFGILAWLAYRSLS